MIKIDWSDLLCAGYKTPTCKINSLNKKNIHFKKYMYSNISFYAESCSFNTLNNLAILSFAVSYYNFNICSLCLPTSTPSITPCEKKDPSSALMLRFYSLLPRLPHVDQGCHMRQICELGFWFI